MTQIRVRDMSIEDEAFVTTCSHVDESDEISACARFRKDHLLKLRALGAIIKVALLDRQHAGVIYGLPIEYSPWGPIGEGLTVVPCLFVVTSAAAHGTGRALLESVEQAAADADRGGISVTAYRDLPGAEWFMPAAFFERLGYQTVASRGREILLWKPFAPDVPAPRLLEPQYEYQPVVGKVAVDLFYNMFCQTSLIEAQRVRDVCAEFGDRVVLREFAAENRTTLLQYQIARAIFVNGEETGWGYEAPKNGIRQAIQEAQCASDSPTT